MTVFFTRFPHVAAWLGMWCVLGFWCSATRATEPYEFTTADPLRENWRVTRFTQLEGHGLRCAAEDHVGAFWFGVQSGVCSYDGYDWRWYGRDDGLSGDPVHHLATRDDGTVVAASDNGLHEFRNGRWSKLFPTDDDLQFTLVAESPAGELWGCTPWGLVRLSADGVTLWTSTDFEEAALQLGIFDVIMRFPQNGLPQSQHLAGMGMARIGRVVATLSPDSPARAAGVQPGDRILAVQGIEDILRDELSHLPGDDVTLRIEHPSGDQETVHFTAANSGHRYRDPAIQQIVFGPDGRVWVGPRFGRLLSSEDGGLTWQSLKEDESPWIGNRSAFTAAPDGNLLIANGIRREGLWRYDGTTWAALDEQVKLQSVAESADGTIWAGNSQDLYAFRDGKRTRYDASLLRLPVDIRQMLIAADGALWLIGYRQYPVRVALSPTEFFSPAGVRYLDTEASGAEWFLDPTVRRLVRSDGDNALSYGPADGLMSDPIGAVAVPDRGVVAFGQHEDVASIATFDGTRWQRHEIPYLSGEFNRKASAVSRNGHVWLQSRHRAGSPKRGGVIAGYGDAWEYIEPTFPAGVTTIVQLHDDSILIGGDWGVSISDGGQWKRVRDRLLVDVHCTHSAVGPDGVLWLATRTKGVLRYRDNVWDQLTTDDGLPSNQVSSIAVTDKGNVWASTANGLAGFDGTRFYRHELLGDLGRFSIHTVGRILWFDRAHRVTCDTSPPRVETLDGPEVSAANAPVLLSWRGIDAWNRTSPEQLQWSYRLNDNDWSVFGPGNQVVLTDLTAGTHTVQVRVRDQAFNVSDASEPLTFAVLAPVWMRPWFVVTASLLGLVFLWQTQSWIGRGITLRKTHAELQVTQAKLAEQFAEQSAQFRAICDCSPIGIFVADPDGTITYVNPRLEQIAGRSAATIRASHCISALHSEDCDRVVAQWKQTIEEGQPRRITGRVVKDDESITWFDALPARIEVDGELHGYIGLVEDVTELKHAEQQAIKRERLSALGQMAAGVAHDINNSLVPLLTYTELLAREAGLSERHAKWLDMIRVGLSDTAATVRRLDHFYRATHDSSNLESVDLGALVRQTVDLTRPQWRDAAQKDGKQISLSVRARGNVRIDGNPAQLRTVITNLIFNAVDAIKGRGTITLDVRRTPTHAEVEIVDDGMGMSAEQLSHCLEPFYTTKTQGSGLGLAECHGAVRQHGGTLHIDSEPNSGTCITLRFPARDDTDFAETLPATAAATTSPAEALLSVLYIDDEEVVRQSVADLIRVLGYSVETAEDGPTGLHLLERGEFGLVLCDQGLPGMNGLDVLREIKSRWPNLPVVIVSGWSLPEQPDGLELDGFLNKPFRLDDLQQLLQDQLPVTPQIDN